MILHECIHYLRTPLAYSLMFSWTKTLTSEPKIAEAYNMLKRQGIILEDPVATDEVVEEEPPPPPREDTLFKDEEKQKVS